MLRRLPDAEQPSRIDAAPLKTATTSSIAFGKGAAGFVAILLPLSATLPSPEARAHGSAAPRSPSLRAGTPGSPSPSISEPLCTGDGTTNTNGSGNGASAAPPNSGPGTPGSPRSPVVNGGGSGSGTFSVEAFTLLVQALIANDRALMERFILFAQAHDLLKKNAERAQKLAQDSNAALETYQRAARELGRQEQVDQLAAEKLAVEERAVEQAEALRRLTEENGVLSARVRTLQLAEDAAAVQEELRTVSTVSECEQTHRLALLEEINLVQTENGSLRQQLRARWGSYSDSGRVGEGTWRHVGSLFFSSISLANRGRCRAVLLLVLLHHICLAT
ncbi:hypothetical protein EDB83DRAFT_2557374 [Lactarius deliciosus]|nr:hypothetical protein EDB83DRAFT_2557374 [Lactarius deliciosus]